MQAAKLAISAEAITATSPASNESEPLPIPLEASDVGVCVELVIFGVVLVWTVGPATDPVVIAMSPDVIVGVAPPVTLVMLLLLTVTEVDVAIAAAVADTEADPVADNVKPGVRGCVSSEDKSVC